MTNPPHNKAPLSWKKMDYDVTNQEAPECLDRGMTEGESFTEENVEEWAKDEIASLRVIFEEYPDKFKSQYDSFLLDLEYLHSLGKISEVEMEEMKKKENFRFE